MISKSLTNEIEKLDLPEKLELVGKVWDSIARDNKQIPLVDWQKAELDERYGRFKRGMYTTENADSVHEELKKKYE